MRRCSESCSNLKNIYVSDKWNTDNVADSQGMFYGCDNLPNYSSSDPLTRHTRTMDQTDI